MPDLKISVIICCYSPDRLQDVREAVTSILSQSCKPQEIIIAVDHTPEVFRNLKAEFSSPVKIILNTGLRGLSETRNTGIRFATGDILAFIDDDAIAAKDWLEKLIAHYSNPQVIAVGGRAVPQWESSQRTHWFPEELDWVVGCTHKGPAPKSAQVRNMIGCNMSFRREAFYKAGLFNSQIGRVGKVNGMGEDTEVCMRIKHTLPEKMILHEPDAVIFHKVPAWRVTWRYLIKRSYNEGLFKNTVRSLSSRLSSSTFTPENSYLKYLLLKSVPERLLRFYRSGSLSQAVAICLCVVCVGIGYLKGRVRTANIADLDIAVLQQE